MKTDLGHWTTKLEIPDDPFGFIYRITSPEGKKYIGKKQMKSRQKRPPLKGKKRKRIVVVESKWRTYTGSSNYLNEDIECFGHDAFQFEIIRFCSCKFELAYYEAKLQFECDVLFRKDYYNGIINLRIGRVPADLQDKFDRNEL